MGSRVRHPHGYRAPHHARACQYNGDARDAATSLESSKVATKKPEQHRPAMSSPKRRRLCTCHGAAATSDSPPPPPPPPPIPVDLLLEIFACTDAKTVVRCAATSKPIRRAVLDPDFRRRAEAAGGGFRPELLLGVSCVYTEADASTYVYQHSRHDLGFDAGLLTSHEPVASRGGFVALLPGRHSPGVPPCPGVPPSVHDSLTGRKLRDLPPSSVQRVFPPAFLDVGGGGDGGRSFQLLIADARLRAQVFSSEHGVWGDVVETLLLPPRPRLSFQAAADASQALVLGRAAVHWLSFADKEIISLDAGAARATVTTLPPGCVERVRSTQPLDMALQLAAAPDGRLGLLAADSYAISMWTMSAASPEEHGRSPASPSAPSPAARWTRQVVIRLPELGREWMSYTVHLLAFGERSGAVVMQVDGVGLVQLNLGSKDACFGVLSREFKRVWQWTALRTCLHEGDLSSVLQAMKHY
ncbi:hypothetical protein ACP4OV_008280 [Aristida adscensionis]